MLFTASGVPLFSRILIYLGFSMETRIVKFKPTPENLIENVTTLRSIKLDVDGARAALVPRVVLATLGVCH